MDLTIEQQTQTEKWVKLNVYPTDHARFKVLAARYGMTMADLFGKTVEALEMSEAERANDAR